jgi:hypothetical protein
MCRDPDSESAFEFEILKASIANEIFEKPPDDTLPSLIERLEQLRKLERKLLRGGTERDLYVSAWIAHFRLAKRNA